MLFCHRLSRLYLIVQAITVVSDVFERCNGCLETFDGIDYIHVDALNFFGQAIGLICDVLHEHQHYHEVEGLHLILQCCRLYPSFHVVLGVGQDIKDF